MSDAFKDYVSRRESEIQSRKSGGGGCWLWALLTLVILALVLFLFLRGDPSTGPVNPNTASMEQLISLPGVGPEMAEKMVLLRRKKAFTKADDLLDVPGIGPKTLEKMRSRLKFE
jgi:competence ComEA-like helix-hairpin-helix protein